MEVISSKNTTAAANVPVKEALRQFLTDAKAEITCLRAIAETKENPNSELAGEITNFIHILCEARSKFSGRPAETDSPCDPSQSLESNDADELKQQLKELQEKHEQEKQQWEMEKLLIQTQQQQHATKTRQQGTSIINSSDTELLETINELKEEVQSTRKAIQSVFATTVEDDDEHIQSLSNDVREIQSCVNRALVELRQASAALKQTLAATRESFTEMNSQSVPERGKRSESRREEMIGKQRTKKASLAYLQKQLEIEIKKRIRAEAEVDILNDQGDAYMDIILDLQTENVQLILKAENDRNNSLPEENKDQAVSDLVPIGTNSSSNVSEFPPIQDESTSWDNIPTFVRSLYQRCEMLEAERQEVLESTVELLESSREANHAKVEAAYNEALVETERNFQSWLDRAMCKRCNSRFEPRLEDGDEPLCSMQHPYVSSTQIT